MAQLVRHCESEKIGEICAAKNRALPDGIG
jgi:hypothetical protein